eukprot:444067_1
MIPGNMIPPPPPPSPPPPPPPTATGPLIVAEVVSSPTRRTPSSGGVDNFGGSSLGLSRPCELPVAMATIIESPSANRLQIEHFQQSALVLRQRQENEWQQLLREQEEEKAKLLQEQQSAEMVHKASDLADKYTLENSDVTGDATQNVPELVANSVDDVCAGLNKEDANLQVSSTKHGIPQVPPPSNHNGNNDQFLQMLMGEEKNQGNIEFEQLLDDLLDHQIDGAQGLSAGPMSLDPMNMHLDDCVERKCSGMNGEPGSALSTELSSEGDSEMRVPSPLDVLLRRSSSTPDRHGSDMLAMLGDLSQHPNALVTPPSLPRDNYSGPLRSDTLPGPLGVRNLAGAFGSHSLPEQLGVHNVSQPLSSESLSVRSVLQPLSVRGTPEPLSSHLDTIQERCCSSFLKDDEPVSGTSPIKPNVPDQEISGILNSTSDSTDPDDPTVQSSESEQVDRPVLPNWANQYLSPHPGFSSAEGQSTRAELSKPAPVHPGLSTDSVSGSDKSGGVVANSTSGTSGVVTSDHAKRRPQKPKSKATSVQKRSKKKRSSTVRICHMCEASCTSTQTKCHNCGIMLRKRHKPVKSCPGCGGICHVALKTCRKCGHKFGEYLANLKAPKRRKKSATKRTNSGKSSEKRTLKKIQSANSDKLIRSQSGATTNSAKHSSFDNCVTTDKRTVPESQTLSVNGIVTLEKSNTAVNGERTVSPIESAQATSESSKTTAEPVNSTNVTSSARESRRKASQRSCKRGKTPMNSSTIRSKSAPRRKSSSRKQRKPRRRSLVSLRSPKPVIGDDIVDPEETPARSVSAPILSHKLFEENGYPVNPNIPVSPGLIFVRFYSETGQDRMIRCWRKERDGRTYYDCCCGRRKPYPDVWMMKRHCRLMHFKNSSSSKFAQPLTLSMAKSTSNSTLLASQNTSEDISIIRPPLVLSQIQSTSESIYHKGLKSLVNRVPLMHPKVSKVSIRTPLKPMSHCCSCMLP